MKDKKWGIGLIVIIVAVYALVTVLFFTTEFPGDSYDYFIRLAVLYGYTSLFFATLSTVFMKELYKIFGKPFLTIHHIFAVAGLILITVHPVAFALKISKWEVFLIDISSWQSFWDLAGRPALYIFYIAAVIVLFRRKLNQKIWRVVHALNYVALTFAYIHGALIGTDFENLAILIIFTAMIVISYEVLIFKRYQKYKRKKKREEKSKE
jgi:DMSO/TMAO reductase YedYZ heme-binding membrane subunit